jgi:hypothetical protein
MRDERETCSDCGEYNKHCTCEDNQEPESNVDSEISESYPSDVPSKTPAPVKFVAVRRAVMRGAEHICTAVSANMAQRIARALNAHTPDRRGR